MIIVPYARLTRLLEVAVLSLTSVLIKRRILHYNIEARKCSYRMDWVYGNVLAFVMQNATKPVKSRLASSEDVSNRTRPGGNATLR